mgnify:CR=1 FL=1
MNSKKINNSIFQLKTEKTKLEADKSSEKIKTETLNASKEILKNKFKISRWIKIILCAILIWITIYSVDYICVTNFFRSPIFSIVVKSNRIHNENVDYIEKKFIGLGYSFYTRGEVEKNKKNYVIYYGKIKILNFEVKDFFQGVCN